MADKTRYGHPDAAEGTLAGYRATKRAQRERILWLLEKHAGELNERGVRLLMRAAEACLMDSEQ